MFVVARKVPTPDPEKPGSQWLYWTGSSWSADRKAAKGFKDRAGAIVAHAELLRSETWPEGGNPLVVKRD